MESIKFIRETHKPFIGEIDYNLKDENNFTYLDYLLRYDNNCDNVQICYHCFHKHVNNSKHLFKCSRSFLQNCIICGRDTNCIRANHQLINICNSINDINSVYEKLYTICDKMIQYVNDDEYDIDNFENDIDDIKCVINDVKDKLIEKIYEAGDDNVDDVDSFMLLRLFNNYSSINIIRYIDTFYYIGRVSNFFDTITDYSKFVEFHKRHYEIVKDGVSYEEYFNNELNMLKDKWLDVIDKCDYRYVYNVCKKYIRFFKNDKHMYDALMNLLLNNINDINEMNYIDVIGLLIKMDKKYMYEYYNDNKYVKYAFEKFKDMF